MSRRRSVVLAWSIAIVAAGCGVGANVSPASFPIPSVGPAVPVSGAVEQTRGEIASALGSVAVQFGPASRPYRPAEASRLREAPRTVFQVVLPDQPDAGFIVVYDFKDPAAAVDAANEEAGFLGTGPARVEYAFGTQHVLRQVGSTVVLYSWLPAASSDSIPGDVAAALGTLGVGFTVPR